MSATHLAFPGERRKNIPGLVRLTAWKGHRKTQESGFPALRFPHCGDKLTDGLPALHFLLGGRERNTPQMKGFLIGSFPLP